MDSIKEKLSNVVPSFENLIQLQLDVSILQQPLTQALTALTSRINHLESQLSHHQTTVTQQIANIYVRIDQQSHDLGLRDEELGDKMDQQHSNLQNLYQHINALQKQLQNQSLIAKMPVISSPPQQKPTSEKKTSTKKIQKKKQRDEIKQPKTQQRESQNQKILQYERKCDQIYNKLVQQLRKKFEEAENTLKQQINGIKMNKLEEISVLNKKNSEDIGISAHSLSQQQIQIGDKKNEQNSILQTPIGSQKIQILTKKVVSENNIKGSQNLIDKKQNQIDELRRQLQQQITKNSQEINEKIEQNSKTTSLITDHIVELKKTISQLSNYLDATKIQVGGIRQKNQASQRQLIVMIDSSNQHKNKIKSIESTLTKLNQQMKIQREKQALLQENMDSQTVEQPRQSSRRDVFRETNSSFRSSVLNLAPVRNPSVLKTNNNKLEVLEETIKKLNLKLGTVIDRLNKMEDQKKRWGFGGQGVLPRIDNKENKSNNVNPFELMKKDIKHVNQELLKTNQRLATTKQKLNQLYDAHAEIPNKIEDIYVKLREYNQLQQDRLIELIKQLINRMLTDPFDNNFTNRLKRQINVKFLEIKHEYNGILKQIQGKVQDRAEKSQLSYFKNSIDETILEIKALANKKCESEEFKKGMKYLENKIKQVYNFAKNQTLTLHNQQKQYIGGKKQLVGNKKQSMTN